MGLIPNNHCNISFPNAFGKEILQWLFGIKPIVVPIGKAQQGTVKRIDNVVKLEIFGGWLGSGSRWRRTEGGLWSKCFNHKDLESACQLRTWAPDEFKQLR